MMKDCFNTIFVSFLLITTSTLALATANNQLATDIISSEKKNTQQHAAELDTENLAVAPVATKASIAPSKKNKDDRFIPSQAISEDLAVSFPVDI